MGKGKKGGFGVEPDSDDESGQMVSDNKLAKKIKENKKNIDYFFYAGLFAGLALLAILGVAIGAYFFPKTSDIESNISYLMNQVNMIKATLETCCPQETTAEVTTIAVDVQGLTSAMQETIA